MFKGKRVLVTGSEGMIGKELCEQLESLGAVLFRFDMKRFWRESQFTEADCLECGKKTKYPLDLRFQSTVHKVFEAFKPDYVFHLFGIKGNPKKTKEKPSNFMIPMLQGDTNIIDACQKHNVKRMLYTSSIAVEHPEDDKYPAWAKLTAETLISAMRVQYPDGTKYAIVRPANVFGRYDNFDNPDSMVVTSVISKGLKNELELWGDGNFERDFISAKRVAELMIKIMSQEELPEEPINACTGVGIKIKDLIDLVASELKVKITKKPEMTSQGSEKRVMVAPGKYYKQIGFNIPPGAFINDIKEVIKWKTGNQM